MKVGRPHVRQFTTIREFLEHAIMGRYPLKDVLLILDNIEHGAALNERDRALAATFRDEVSREDFENPMWIRGWNAGKHAGLHEARTGSPVPLPTIESVAPEFHNDAPAQPPRVEEVSKAEFEQARLAIMQARVDQNCCPRCARPWDQPNPPTTHSVCSTCATPPAPGN